MPSLYQTSPSPVSSGGVPRIFEEGGPMLIWFVSKSVSSKLSTISTIVFSPIQCLYQITGLFLDNSDFRKDVPDRPPPPRNPPLSASEDYTLYHCWFTTGPTSKTVG